MDTVWGMEKQQRPRTSHKLLMKGIRRQLFSETSRAGRSENSTEIVLGREAVQDNCTSGLCSQAQ